MVKFEALNSLCRPPGILAVWSQLIEPCPRGHRHSERAECPLRCKRFAFECVAALNSNEVTDSRCAPAVQRDRRGTFTVSFRLLHRCLPDVAGVLNFGGELFDARYNPPLLVERR